MESEMLNQRSGGSALDQKSAIIPAGLGLTVPTLIMISGSSQSVAGGQSASGWVSGDIASLAASATAIALFDIGPDWDQYHTITININPVGPSSGLSNIQFSGRDDPTLAIDPLRRMGPANSTAGQVYSGAVTTAGGPQQFVVRPVGRFVVVSATNADGANPVGAAAHICVVALATS